MKLSVTQLLVIFAVVSFICVVAFGDRGNEDYSAKLYKNPTENYCNIPVNETTVIFDIDFDRLTTPLDSIQGRLVEAVTYRPNGGLDYPLPHTCEVTVNLNALTTMTKGVHTEFIVHYSDKSSRTADFKFDVIERNDSCLFSERNYSTVVLDSMSIPLFL